MSQHRIHISFCLGDLTTLGKHSVTAGPVRSSLSSWTPHQCLFRKHTQDNFGFTYSVNKFQHLVYTKHYRRRGITDAALTSETFSSVDAFDLFPDPTVFLTTHPSLSRTAPVYICCPQVIINSALFHSPECPSLDDKLYGYSIQSPFLKNAFFGMKSNTQRKVQKYSILYFQSSLELAKVKRVPKLSRKWL